jgi:hypothetical protein
MPDSDRGDRIDLDALNLRGKRGERETLKSWRCHLMSRGLGRVQQQLIEIFDKNPRQVFSTLELCHRIFPGTEITKKHRVSVLRAIKLLVRAQRLDIWRAVSAGQRNDYWFNGSRAFRRSKPRRNVARANEARPRKGRALKPPA